MICGTFALIQLPLYQRVSSGGQKIGGFEGTRQMIGMLLMTLGLIEVVKLTHRQEWVIFLDKETYLPIVQPRAQTLLRQTRYQRAKCVQVKSSYTGNPGISRLSAHSGSLAECQRDLAEAMINCLLLRLACRQE